MLTTNKEYTNDMQTACYYFTKKYKKSYAYLTDICYFKQKYELHDILTWFPTVLLNIIDEYTEEKIHFEYYIEYHDPNFLTLSMFPCITKNSYYIYYIKVILSNNYNIKYCIAFDGTCVFSSGTRKVEEMSIANDKTVAAHSYVDRKSACVYKMKRKLMAILNKYKFKNIKESHDFFLDFMYDTKHINYKHMTSTLQTDIFRLIVFIHNLIIKYL